MSKIELYYFNVKGLGEGVRMLLTYGGQEFIDHHVQIMTPEWDALKPKTPFGQLPMLVIDGKKYCQSYAIYRYLGRKYGLAGDNSEEELEIDQNMDFYKDLWTKAAKAFYETDENIKARNQEELQKNFFPDVLKKLDEIVAKNNGHIALGKLTWGDFLFAGMYDNHKRIFLMPDLYDKYPNLQRIYDNVAALPKVKAYIEASPKYEF